MPRRQRSLARSERLIQSPDLRRRLIESGYETARAHTLERQAAEMMRVVTTELGIQPRTILEQPLANASWRA